MESTLTGTANLLGGSQTAGTYDVSTPINPERIPDVGRWSEWINREYSWDNRWELLQGLVVQFEVSPDSVTAIPQLEGIDEFGEGASQNEALRDLLTSFTDYLEALERREKELHPVAIKELEVLRKLINRKDAQ